MTGQELAERCFDIPARVERIVHLAVLGEMEDDVLEWLTDDAAGALGKALGYQVEDIPGMGDSSVFARAEALGMALAGRSVRGWLVEVSTPAHYPGGDGLTRFSWGNYLSQVFYGESYGEALDQGLHWAATQASQPVGA